jgi:hypothetical protein
MSAESTRDEPGCTCHGCGVRYKVDFLVPDGLWCAIGMTGPGGLLCGRCIVGKIEALGEFAAFTVRPVE